MSVSAQAVSRNHTLYMVQARGMRRRSDPVVLKQTPIVQLLWYSPTHEDCSGRVGEICKDQSQ